MPITIHIHFKGVGSKQDAPKNKSVTWSLVKGTLLKQQTDTVLKSGTTNTTPDGVLIIADVEMEPTGSYRVDYTIGAQMGSLIVPRSADDPLVIPYYLSLRLELKMIDNADKTALKDTNLTWEILTKQPVANGITDGDGKFIQDIEITERETYQLKVTVARANQTVQIKHNEDTKAGRPFLAEKGFTQPKVVQAAVAVVLTNPDRNWLTYESLFNKKEFKKPNCEFKLHLYLIPMTDIVIWLRDSVQDNHLQTFVNAFFPDFETSQIKRLAKCFWSWKYVRSRPSAAYIDLIIQSPQITVGDRDKNTLYLKPYAVLPYNRFDNTKDSRALGTTDPDKKLLRVKDAAPYLWSAWKTASRSCIVRLPAAPTKDKGQLWKTGGADAIARDYEQWMFDVSHRGPELETLHDNPYNLAARVDDLDFSLKTGVEWVGVNFQGGGDHKDIIGDWLIGCLRSDYITEVNTLLAPPRENLIVLTELITITEKKTRELTTRDGQMNYMEGIQVRDISLLNKDKIYLAPLNIPFVSLDLKEFKPEFYYLDVRATENERNQWRAFWKEAFAGALGRAKALLLLRYGLQIVNPNQQNFLIEFDTAGKPTGAIAVRDLNDASIHREMVWGLFNGSGLPSQDQGKESWQVLATLDVSTFKFEFTVGRMEAEGFGHQDRQETGTTDKKFGPPGTQFLWQRFSSFGNITKPAKGVGDNLPLFKNLLETMSDWGIAHDKWFISCVESHLGVNFTDIDWSKYPDSTRFQKVKTIKGAEEEVKPVIVDISPNNNGLEITGFSFAKLLDQQKQDLDAKIWDQQKQDLNTAIQELEIPVLQKQEIAAKILGQQKLQVASIIQSEGLSNLQQQGLDAIIQGAYLWEDECLQIFGKGFKENAVVKIGKSVVASKYVIGKADLLVVSPKVVGLDAIKQQDVQNGGIEVTNPDSTVAHYKYIYDPNYLSEMDWEETMARFIHDYLASEVGQRAIRGCRRRKWQPVKPAFIIRLLDEKEKPITYKQIFMRTEEKTWNDLTDSKGEIQIYQFSPTDCKISVTNVNDVFIDVKQIRDWKEVIVDRRGFVAKIKYVE